MSETPTSESIFKDIIRLIERPQMQMINAKSSCELYVSQIVNDHLSNQDRKELLKLYPDLKIIVTKEPK